MKVLKSIKEASEYSFSKQIEGLSIGLVPTMGALHQGHLSLIEASKKDNNHTIASIFVNPIQFNNVNDLAKYPRTLEKDLEMLEKAGCNAVFVPDELEMYRSKPLISIDFGSLEKVMEGAFRPGHFSGVGVVVAKLFNIICPNHAYFGQKDLQQFLVIQQLVLDLSFPLTLHCCPILREADGLAMSSRNVRLSPENRPIAAKIIEALKMAESKIKNEGIDDIKLAVKNHIAQYKGLELEYFEISDAITLEPIMTFNSHQKVALCIAVFLDGVRLIDNLLVE